KPFAESRPGERGPYPDAAPFPDGRWRMIDTTDRFVPDGGSKGLGFVRGTKVVDPAAWFFKAHFQGDPVCPGTLGLESFLQLLEYAAARRWGTPPEAVWQSVAHGVPHTWTYRGQVVPANHEVVVEADVTGIDDARRVVTADGY